MRRIAVMAPVALTLLAAGCGGASKSSSSTPASQPASTPATPASSGSGPYGQSSSGSSAGATRVALITTKHGKLGTILAYGSKKLTVYLFEADRGGGSRCTGACAAVWPPVLGTPKTQDGAVNAALGTIIRPGGSKQVTYRGHPLYLFVKDGDDGDAYGEGIKSFGAEWYVLNPAGKKVDRS